MIANASNSFMIGTDSWKQQFSDALQVEIGDSSIHLNKTC